jgi:hypothetical protein
VAQANRRTPSHSSVGNDKTREDITPEVEMKQLVEYSLEDGTKFLIEVDEPESTAFERVALPSGQLVVKAQNHLKKRWTRLNL